MCKYCSDCSIVPEGCDMTGNEIREMVEDESWQWGGIDGLLDDMIDRCYEDETISEKEKEWAKEHLDIRVIIK